MTFNTACSRLRLGGTITGSTLTGGTLIDTGGIAISAWSGLLDFPGYRGTNPTLLSSDGNFHRSNKPVRARTLTLNLQARSRSATGLVTTSHNEHLEANLDDILELIAGDGEQVILERDMQDGSTRWIRIQPLAAIAYTQGPIFNQTLAMYDLPVVCEAAYPFWQSETLHAEVVTPGADTIVNAGNARIGNASLAFAGAGVITNDDNGDELEANAACTVDIGTRNISNAGSPTPGRLEPPNREWWMSFAAGTVNVTVQTSNVTVTYRDHWW
jgi:hypothetical protein